MYTYCHLTSDIFAVCMPSDMESIYRVIDSIQTSMNHYPVNFEMVMSFGIYIITEKDKQERIPVVTMVDRAAIAQRVKNNYMNKIAVFDDKIAEKEYAEQNVIMEMNNALGSDQFHIYLQPKVDMITGRIVGSEAMRADSSDNMWISGFCSRHLEGNGFISEIDFYMLYRFAK